MGVEKGRPLPFLALPEGSRLSLFISSMNPFQSLLFGADHITSPLPANLPGRALLTALVQAVEIKEPKLRGHGARTAGYALELGRAIQLSDQDLVHLNYAAYLHDVGKLAVPEEILTKQGPLTSREYHQLQSHPRAATVLLDSWPFLKIPSIWIAHHHEHWDGSGYPNGLKGAFIPLGSRIIAIADAYDVLTVRNLSDSEIDPNECLSILRWYSGSQFDPELIETFSTLVHQWDGLVTCTT